MKNPMQRLGLAVLLGMQGGEPGDGMQLYRDGKFAEAAAAFRAAIDRGDSAELQWNLALASWRAGDLVAAETAAEKYAALSKNARTDLHAGLLGAVRHAEAMALELQADQATQTPPSAAAAPGGEQPADALPMLEQALQKATQAKDWFVRGASAKATPELLRNMERSLRTIDELQKKVDELKKQREQQQKDDEKDPEKKDPEKKDPEKKDDEKKDDKKDGGEQKPEEKQEQKSDDKGEPKPDGQQQGDDKPEPKPGQQDEQSKDGAKQDGASGEAPPQGEPKGEPGARHDAPGEAREGKELTPEQQQRLLEELGKADAKVKEIRLRGRTARRLVERDW